MHRPLDAVTNTGLHTALERTQVQAALAALSSQPHPFTSATTDTLREDTLQQDEKPQDIRAPYFLHDNTTYINY